MIVLLNVFATVFFLGTRTLAVFRNLPFFLNEEVKLLRLLSNDRLNDGAPKDSSLDLAVARTLLTDVFARDARVRPRSSEYSYQNISSNLFDNTAPTFISIYPKIQCLLKITKTTYLMLYNRF